MHPLVNFLQVLNRVEVMGMVEGCRLHDPGSLGVLKFQ